MIKVNMEKAREIKRDQLRAERKQQLRDVTADPAIDAATTPDELKAVWPEALEETE